MRRPSRDPTSPVCPSLTSIAGAATAGKTCALSGGFGVGIKKKKPRKQKPRKRVWVFEGDCEPTSEKCECGPTVRWHDRHLRHGRGRPQVARAPGQQEAHGLDGGPLRLVAVSRAMSGDVCRASPSAQFRNRTGVISAAAVRRVLYGCVRTYHSQNVPNTCAFLPPHGVWP